MVINAYLSIITLNVNALNVPVKRHRVAKRIKIRLVHLLPMGDPLQIKKT